MHEKYFDVFMRHYLILRTQKIPNKRKVYKAFKDYAAEKGDVQSLVADVHQFAIYYCLMALNKEQKESLAKAFHDLGELNLDVAYPFLLYLYHDYEHRSLDDAAFEEAVRIIESYLFRRAVCGLPSNSHNKVMLAILKKYTVDGHLGAVKKHLLGLRDNRRFPDNEEFHHMFVKHRFVNTKYWLYRLENNDRKESITRVEYTGRKYTVEHIMPQKLNDKWRASLGPDHKRIHEDYLNSPGNITLTGYNSEYGNRPFAYKRDTKGGFKQSPLKLNKDLGTIKKWTEDTIKHRASNLADMATKVWLFPR